MYDVSPHLGAAPKTFEAGLEYQYWRNKFGSSANTEKVPQLVLQWIL